MDPNTIGWISIAMVFVLLFLGLPVAFALALLGFIGCWLLSGIVPAVNVMGIIPYGGIASYTFTVIPLFILMGNLAYHAGFGADIFRTAHYWLARVPGGLAQATVAGCSVFGAVSGSGLAACAMMSKIAIPEMERYGYNRKLAFGTVASAGPIAQMIPPSILFVIYGVITEQSVSKLLIAGIIPGIITAINFMTFIYIRVRRNPALAPLSLKVISWRDRFIALRDAWVVGLLAFIIIGGIYSGVFTPTEAGGVAAFTTFVLGLAKKRLNRKKITEAVVDSMKITGMIFLIMVGAFIFGTFMAISQLPLKMSDFLSTVVVHRFVILLGVIVLYLILGTFIDMIAGMFLTLPIIFPAIKSLGYDPIWFGVIVVHLCEIALLTPPYGLNLFIIKGVVPNSSMGEIIRGVGPFILVDIVTMAIFIAFPQVALFLPNKMGM